MKFFQPYRQIPHHTLLVIAAKFLCGLVNTAFVLVLNIYLRKQGLPDEAIAGMVAFQYAGGLFLSLPLGLFLRGRRIKPFMMAGAILVPLVSTSALIAFETEHFNLGKWLLLLLSMSFLQLDSFTLPFIVRTRQPDSEPEAISLAYSVYAVGMVFTGLLIMAITYIGPIDLGPFTWPGNEFSALISIALLALPAIFLLLPVKETTPDPTGKITTSNLSLILSGYDWGRIARGLLPTSLLAIGAGLTIPFINLFFNSVFHLDSGTLALIGMASAVLVALLALAVPRIRRRHGYTVAITWAQCLAVLMLILMALTELFAHVPGMVILAVLFYLCRNPLMNMAGPMSNELVMKYVGPRNQDLTGALHAAIWSGAWFVSASLFQFFRATGLPYYQIFLLTAAFYSIAIFFYALLIRAYSRTLPV